MRSQMAEGWGRHLAQPGSVDVRSGGTRPAGFVHPQAVRVMQEVGVDISRHRSGPIDLAFAAAADAFVTLCGPLDDACPAPLARRVIDWTLPDPSWGGDDEVRRARDIIRDRVRNLYLAWGVLRPEAEP
jgi:arsenate reductase (thioredoxin)